MSGITPGKTYSPQVTTAGRKDAFHVACVLCRISPDSLYLLEAGDGVLLAGECEAAWCDDESYCDGIVDPFIDQKIYKDSKQLFWVFLRPERVRDLTHSFHVVERPEPEPVSEPGEDWNAGCRKCNS